MKVPLSSFILVLTITVSFAQEFEVPQNYVIKEPEDYEKYKPDMIRCIDWLMATPVNEQQEKRMDAGAFMMKWLTGTPNLTIELREKIVNFMDVNPDLLLIFMGGWTNYVLATNDSSALNCNKKGIEAVIIFYQKNRALLQKDKNVEKYIKLKESGTLEDYLKKYIDP